MALDSQRRLLASYNVRPRRTRHSSGTHSLTALCALCNQPCGASGICPAFKPPKKSNASCGVGCKKPEKCASCMPSVHFGTCFFWVTPLPRIFNEAEYSAKRGLSARGIRKTAPHIRASSTGLSYSFWLEVFWRLYGSLPQQLDGHRNNYSRHPHSAMRVRLARTAIP
jgi:hypothetical protein